MTHAGAAAVSEAALPGSLGPELARLLEKEITELRLAPGTKLVEEELCVRFGISRSPVREALQILAGHGLVERLPRRGMVVAPLSLSLLDEIYSCRKPLEALAAAGVTANATPKLIDDLAALVRGMAAADRKKRLDEAFAANVALTDLLHRHCGNETLMRILQRLDKQALRYRFYCYRESGEILAASIEANEELVAAIRARDPVRAAAVTERLIGRSWELVRSLLEASSRFGTGENAKATPDGRK
jgi:DNA-binding GntR family transcriptional regulator